MRGWREAREARLFPGLLACGAPQKRRYSAMLRNPGPARMGLAWIASSGTAPTPGCGYGLDPTVGDSPAHSNQGASTSRQLCFTGASMLTLYGLIRSPAVGALADAVGVGCGHVTPYHGVCHEKFLFQLNKWRHSGRQPIKHLCAINHGSTIDPSPIPR